MPEYLYVPFAEKDQAKTLGAKWDHHSKRWFIPSNRDPAPFQKWRYPENRDTRPGDPSQLFIDLVPRSAWFSNLRKELAENEWKELGRHTRQAAGMRCVACGAQGVRLDTHERWSFREDGIQRLEKLVALCVPCHEVTHFGLAEVRGRRAEAKAHLMKIASLNSAQAEKHISEAFEVWRTRSGKSWILDARAIFGLPIRFSAKTRNKIEEHAKGLVDRDTTPPPDVAEEMQRNEAAADREAAFFRNLLS